MSGHFALEAQSRSLTPDDENGRMCSEHGTTTSMAAQPETQAQHQRPWHMANFIADDSFKLGRQIEPQREGTASMDVLTHKFSNSHLRLDNGIQSSLSRYSTSACSSVREPKVNEIG